jgi:hypothetical protein
MTQILKTKGGTSTSIQITRTTTPICVTSLWWASQILFIENRFDSNIRLLIDLERLVVKTYKGVSSASIIRKI